MEYNEVVRKRGFKPSDRFDPNKAEVLTSLTKKILHLEERKSGHGYPMDWRMRKILCPRPEYFQDPEPHPQRIQKKVFASSDFFSQIHPTLDEEKSKAKEISTSITLPENANSKGQVMFQSRKKKSVKWVHQGHEFQKEVEEIHESPNWNSLKSSPAPPPLQKSFSAGRFPISWDQPLSPKKDVFHLPVTHNFRQQLRHVEHWKTYNTAPRGYFQGQTIYHPIYMA